MKALLGCVLLAGCASNQTASPATTSPATTSAATSSGSGGAPLLDPCTACTTPSTAGTLPSVITEASGIVASRVHAGVYYVHNDSGDTPRFFAIDEGGANLGTFTLTGASAVDWEDVAIGPCGAVDDGSCLYLADIGDNGKVRTGYVVYRVREPAALGAGVHALESEALPFTYPDGSHNAETLLLHPQTLELAVVTKTASGPSGIYVFPGEPTPGAPMTLAKAGEVTAPEGSSLYTGGAVHPAGRGALLRTYTHLFFYGLEPSETIAAALARPPCSLYVAPELQGEAVGWRASGDGYVTVSEGAGSSLHLVACAR